MGTTPPPSPTSSSCMYVVTSMYNQLFENKLSSETYNINSETNIFVKMF
jgi:hypothetical protein